jgi:uncharacterized protein (UPF0548 family)
VISLKHIDDATLDSLIDSQRGQPFTYEPLGLSRNATAPDGFVVDHNRTRVGSGAADFARVIDAVRAWEMFNLGWVRVHRTTTPIAVDSCVAVVAAFPGVQWANVARVVYTIDDDSEQTRRFGFGYGTLPDHAERGEERFSVEWHADDDSVWYDVFAFSQPAHPLARLGFPVARAAQRRFGKGTLAAMRAAVARRR